jgi:tetratricopeptide repeat protein 21B
VPCAVALAWFHQQCEMVDHDAVREQQMLVETGKGSLGSNSDHAVLALMFCIAVRDLDMAKRVVEMCEESSTVVALRGWIEVYEHQKDNSSQAHVKQALDCFDQAIKATPSLLELEALMGKLKVFEDRRDWAEALRAIDLVIVNHSWYIPVNVEKAKVFMMTADMEQAVEIAQNSVLDKEPDNIDALRVNALYVLTREARQNNAHQIVNRLARAIRTIEPRNHKVMYQCSRLIARIAAKKESILEVTLELISTACQLSPNTAKYFTEKGYQLQLLGRLPDACEFYHQASTKDETDVTALYGIIHARILEGNLEEAEEQLEFISEIQVSMGKTSDLAYLGCLIKWRRHRDAEAAINYLNEAFMLHITSFK